MKTTEVISRSQDTLRHVISYIEFLQRRIQDTQDKLVPYSSLLGFRPLWTPQLSLDSTKKAGKCPSNTPKKCQLKACAESLMPETELGMGQKLVSYLSSSSSENGDTGPWLVSVALSPHPPLSPCTPRSLTSAFLGLSPSLQSSPANDVMVGGLLSPVLFEEVQICGSLSQESTGASTLSLDHSYQLQKGISTGSSGLRQDGSLKENQRVESSAGSELKIRKLSSMTKAKARSKAQGVKVKPPASGHPPSAQTSGKTPDPSRPQPIKKKCVNGFIMFCRMNRKAYLRANPGTASTAATRDLAELWKRMSLQERRPYCMKALQFSLIHDRLVKQRNVMIPHSDVSPPKPLSVLLEEKSLPAAIP